MNFLPHFTISIFNAFWFSLLFWIGNVIILKIFPSHYKNRVLKMPKLNGASQKIISTLNFFLFQGLLIIVLFMPLKFDTSYFVFGLVLFVVAFSAYLISLINYARSNPEKPVTKGIYKLSRNPQQITTIFMWIGIGFMTNCSLIVVICILHFFTAYPTFKAQEKFCIDKYGNDYIEYMKRSPRYFLLFYRNLNKAHKHNNAKNNSRNSSKSEGCSPLQLFCDLTGKCHTVGYYSYTNSQTAQKPILDPCVFGGLSEKKSNTGFPELGI